MRKRNTSGPQRNRKDSSGPSDHRKRSSASYKKPGTGFTKRSNEDSPDERKRPTSSRTKGPVKGNFKSSSSRNESSSSRFSKGSQDRSETRGKFQKRDDDRTGKRPYTSRGENKEGGKQDKPFSGKRSFSESKDKRPFKSRSGDATKPFERSDSRGTSNRFSKAPKSDDRYERKTRFTKGRDDRDGTKPTRKRGDESAGHFSKPFKTTDRDERKSQLRKGRDEKEHLAKPPIADKDSGGNFKRREPRKRTSSVKREEKFYTSKAGGKFDEASPETGKIRLNKYISNSGVCSRREADELIKMGLISVNGKTITELGYKVNPGDEVRHESTVLKAEKPVYILLNKPKGFITTTNDPQERNTVMHIIGNAVKERIYPVGRLDRNTTGLLFLTNDGDLADKLMHPSYKAKKIYKAELDRALTKGDLKKIQEGVELEEGIAVVDDVAIISEDGKTVGLELHIGWNRVVRRIFEALGYEVVKLDRSVYAGLDKKDLPRGHWRFLKKEEIVHLKHYK